MADQSTVISVKSEIMINIRLRFIVRKLFRKDHDIN